MPVSPFSLSAFQRFSLSLFCFLLSALCFPAFASVLNDPFAYPDGPLVTVSTNAWTTHSGLITGQVAVVTGRAFLSDTNTEDVNRLLSQSFAPASGATLYARFTLNCARLPSTSGDYFAHFKAASDTTFRAKVFALTQGAAAGHFRLGIANFSNAPNAVLALDLATNIPHIRDHDDVLPRARLGQRLALFRHEFVNRREHHAAAGRVQQAGAMPMDDRCVAATTRRRWVLAAPSPQVGRDNIQCGVDLATGRRSHPAATGASQLHSRGGKQCRRHR